jgi:hypothetical protein
MSVGRTRVSAEKGHNFWSDRWITLKFLQGFQEGVFVGVVVESLFSDKDVWSATLNIGSKGPNILSDSWITLKFLQGFPEAVFRGVSTECLLGDEDVWATEQEYRLKRAITFGPTVGSLSNFYYCFQRLFSLG